MKHPCKTVTLSQYLSTKGIATYRYYIKPYLSVCRNTITLENTLFTIILVIAVIGSSNLMTDTHIPPRQYFTSLAILISTFFLCIKLLLNHPIKIQFSDVSLIITIICAYESIYSLFQVRYCGIFASPAGISGHFDNPAGLISCICLGLPFAIYLYNLNTKIQRILAVSSIALISLAAILSQSRTGIISCVLIICISNIKKSSFKHAISIGTCFTVISILISYFLKKESADGRILIWQCSWNMIKEMPFFGYGTDGFKRLYMHYQAKTLVTNPDNPSSLLADNIMTPFNEYINLIISFGWFGAIMLIVFILLIIAANYKSSTEKQKTAIISLISIGFISAFSYPFSYPFAYIILALDVFVTFKKWNIPINYKKFRIFFSIASMAILGCGIFSISKSINYELRWKQAYIHKNFNEYEQILPHFNHKPFFLYNYAVELFNIGETTKSLELALLCKKQLANYNLELLLGDIYSKLGNISQAEIHYIHASNMCPCRFIPLNNLYDLYKAADMDEKAIYIASIIVNKPIKIKSLTVKQIKYKMNQALKVANI